MDVKNIRMILSAIKHKSLSKAAEELSYTPSAMSHITDSVEQVLGVRILERSPLGVILTSEGEELYPYLLALADSESKLLQAAHSISKSKENRLRIGAFSSISQNVLPEIIGSFRAEYPNIKISVAVEDNLEKWLESGLADVIFSDELSHGDNVWMPIKADPFVAVVPTDMFVGKRSVSRDELYKQTYISINEKILDSYFELDKFENILNFDSVDNVSVLYMIEQHLGFSVLPSLMVNKRIKGIKSLRLDPPVCRTIGVAYKKNAKLNHATRLFLKYISNKRQQ